jgi:hypothetical protein
MAITRGTTPPFTMSLSTKIDPEVIKKIWVTFSQSKQEIFTIDKCSYNDGVIYFKLTQEHTLKLRSGAPVEIQARILLNDDNCLATDPEIETVKPILKEGVMR